MNRFFRFGLAAAAGFLLAFAVSGEASWKESLDEAEVHFINGRHDASDEVLTRLSSGTVESETSPEALLKTGLAALWKGRNALARNDEVAAERYLLGAAATAEKIRGYTVSGTGPLLAGAYLLEAEARAEVMLFKGVGFIIKNGSLVQELSEKTLELDPSNPEALVIYAQGRINAPRLFGGNRKEGIQILENLWNRRPGGTEGPEMTLPQSFRVAISLGESLAKSDPSEAARYFRAALTLAPESPRAREGLDALR